ncbi:hypothetical protein ACWDSL_49605 [Streptomyces sp. NPDC000941]
MTKPRLTEQEHVEIGRMLAAMQRQLNSLHVQLENAYPRQGFEGAPARKVGLVGRALEIARCELDHALFRDHPNASTSVYYPQR